MRTCASALVLTVPSASTASRIKWRNETTTTDFQTLMHQISTFLHLVLSRFDVSESALVSVLGSAALASKEADVSDTARAVLSEVCGSATQGLPVTPVTMITMLSVSVQLRESPPLTCDRCYSLPLIESRSATPH